MRLRVLREVGLMAWRDYLRTPDALFWTYGFPLVMALVLGLAFGDRPPEPSRVAVVGDRPADVQAFEQALADRPAELQVVTVESASARLDLVLGTVDAVLAGTLADPSIQLDPKRPGAALAELRLERALAVARGEVARATPRIEAVTEPGGRYIDFLLAGLIGINLLGAGIYGVGYNVVQMRVRNLLRRIRVTPVGRAEFLTGFLASKLLLAVFPPLVLIGFGTTVFEVPVRGSWFAVLGLVCAGSFAFGGVGLLVAARVATLEAASGLMNLVMLPMWLLGGAFFSNDRFPAAIQPLIHALPLTWLTDGLRAAMLGTSDGPSALVCASVLVGFGLASFALALRIFRWS